MLAVTFSPKVITSSSFYCSFTITVFKRTSESFFFKRTKFLILKKRNLEDRPCPLSSPYPFHEVGVSLWQIDEVTVIEEFVAFQTTENPLNVDQVT
jgi:hypothetical protein